jgi:hypothetical protein
MITEQDLADYALEMRTQVCSRCIVRRPDCPPCGPRGVGCGIEKHLPEIVDICHEVDSVLIDPYLERLLNLVCAECALRDSNVCPCPLKYLLPLAVKAVETVDQRRDSSGATLA